jgi:poly-gamma-glutamate capsule biosynthesis protein CapA/YwtB (metallophosphatase superfamily)
MKREIPAFFMVWCLIVSLGSVSAQDQQQKQQVATELQFYPLIYQRAAKSGETAEIIIVGDVSFARGVEEATARYGMDFSLEKVSGWLKAADLAVGNYEGVLAAENIGTQQKGGYRLRAKPEVAKALVSAGFDLVSLANNHTMDWGSDGLKATIENLNAAGISTVGAGKNRPSAKNPVVTKVNGIRIVWLAYTMITDPTTNAPESDESWGRSWLVMSTAHEDLIRQVKAARDLGDVVIVQFHWGVEYAPFPQDWQIALARATVDAGASLVVGHHPHVVQPIEVYKNSVIAYSLGNFLFDQDYSPGLALWIGLDKNGLNEVRAVAVHPGIQPEWYSPSRSAAEWRDLCYVGDEQAISFGFTGETYQLLNETTLAGHRESLDKTAREIGQIDMTGDGISERITLDDGRLYVYEGEQQVYASYPEWYVSDAALGDPNQDGRWEVIMLYWKQEKPDAPVSTHPFILAYRGGDYKIIWGGSATTAQLQTLKIADINGDRLDELITIERDPDALLCDFRDRVVVTSWNGWGFTRRWISDYGHFTALTIDLSDQPAIVVRGRSADEKSISTLSNFAYMPAT